MAPKRGLDERCSYVAGDMFEAVPSVEVYFLKHIFHDWSDEESTVILPRIRENAPEDARVFIVEHVVPGPDTPHLAKLFDVRMMVVSRGRERTTDEYYDLLADSGREYVDTRYPENRLMGVVEAVTA